MFGIDPWQNIGSEEFRLSKNHQQVLLNLFFLKFDFLARPSDELFALEDQHGIDPWFEFMKRIQQYPEEDHPHFKGSFILDWTQTIDVGFYFANGSRNGEGALWIVDATATGKTLQVIKVAQILKKMAQLGRSDKSLGIPLLFHPKMQLTQKRAKNQDPVYIAQMDLRVDLSEVWANIENPGERIFIKLVLPADTVEQCAQYLEKRGLNRDFIFSD